MGARLTEKKVGRWKPCGWGGEETGHGAGLWGCWVLLGMAGVVFWGGLGVIGAWLVGLWVAGCYLNKASYIGCIALGWRGFRVFFF